MSVCFEFILMPVQVKPDKCLSGIQIKNENFQEKMLNAL